MDNIYPVDYLQTAWKLITYEHDCKHCAQFHLNIPSNSQNFTGVALLS